ncbi:hypothetical protein PIB30_082118 [Stylosanthes scabra]|uniref:FBD domain-containing protein n=1 Tax=Stylosanthes scabra TaxID=79078 RepID=A0ABU6XU61_9FABA|nr:hypothetical protein [Stylosanthes scabra]
MAADCSRSSKRQKLDESTSADPSFVNEIEIDIVSTLPDCLLCHILSFLPNKTTTLVATTSVLSRRWRYLWKDLQVFHFYLYKVSPNYCTAKSPLFVSIKTFLSLRTARSFRKFDLTCDIEEQELSTVKSWVETAIGSNLEEFQFQLFVRSGRNLVMPDTIFNCTALVTLTLGTCGQIVTILNRSSYHLPSLKKFFLVIESSNNLEALLSGCPVLETLKVVINHKCPNPNPNKKETIRVVSSSLKRLNIRACYEGAIIEELEIDASSLEYLCLTISGKLEEVSARNLHKVETADLHFSSADGGYSLMELLNEIHNASDLSLYPSPRDSVALPIRDLMEFNHLQKLTVEYFDPTVVMDLLGKCHVLKDLKFFWREDDRLPWREPMDVPNCVASHLESVSFFMDCGSKKDIGFITYILEKGLILNSVKIWAVVRGFYLPKEVSLEPTGSKMCQLEIKFVASSEDFDSSLRTYWLEFGPQPEGDSQEWTEPVEVPNCLVSHLECVTFFMYLGTEGDKEFVSYILQKGLIWKSVTVWADPMEFDVDSTDEEELSLIPPASKCVNAT